MAGSYPDVPSRRMAYDADGTVVMSRRHDVQASPYVEATPTTKVELNDEDGVDLGNPGGIPFQSTPNQTALWHLCFIFPELRELDGIFVAVHSVDSTRMDALESSQDTTNGIDGLWTANDTVDMELFEVYPDGYREDIRSQAIGGIRAARFAMIMDSSNFESSQLRAVHLYGEISPGETPDRLLWIDETTGLEFTLPIDFGDVPRGSAGDRLVRLKNNSAALAANTIQITAEAIYLGSAAWYTFDVAGGGFASTRQIASLGAGATSGLITIRQDVPDSETLGPHAARAYANVNSWS